MRKSHQEWGQCRGKTETASAKPCSFLDPLHGLNQPVKLLKCWLQIQVTRNDASEAINTALCSAIYLIKIYIGEIQCICYNATLHLHTFAAEPVSLHPGT